MRSDYKSARAGHTEKVDSPYWKKLTTFPELVDSFAKNVDFVRILLTLHTIFVYFVLSWLTRLLSRRQPLTMKNTRGVPCGRGQTALQTVSHHPTFFRPISDL